MRRVRRGAADIGDRVSALVAGYGSGERRWLVGHGEDYVDAGS
jgi:hypothetical protein